MQSDQLQMKLPCSSIAIQDASLTSQKAILSISHRISYALSYPQHTSLCHARHDARDGIWQKHCIERRWSSVYLPSPRWAHWAGLGMISLNSM